MTAPLLRDVLSVAVLYFTIASTLSEARTLECPGDIYFFVNQTTDFSREVYARTKTDSLMDCVRRCYGSQFCFSAIYTPQEGRKAECTLSYLSLYRCSQRKLIKEYPEPTSESPTIIECLRCPALGESGEVDEGSEESTDTSPDQTTTEDKNNSVEPEVPGIDTGAVINPETQESKAPSTIEPTNPPTTPAPTTPEPTTPPTEPPTTPTDPPTRPTEPPTLPTKPPTLPTEPSTLPTEPPTLPTTEAIEATTIESAEETTVAETDEITEEPDITIGQQGTKTDTSEQSTIQETSTLPSTSATRNASASIATATSFSSVRTTSEDGASMTDQETLLTSPEPSFTTVDQTLDPNDVTAPEKSTTLLEIMSSRPLPTSSSTVENSVTSDMYPYLSSTITPSIAEITPSEDEETSSTQPELSIVTDPNVRETSTTGGVETDLGAGTTETSFTESESLSSSAEEEKQSPTTYIPTTSEGSLSSSTSGVLEEEQATSTLNTEATHAPTEITEQTTSSEAVKEQITTVKNSITEFQTDSPEPTESTTAKESEFTSEPVTDFATTEDDLTTLDSFVTVEALENSSPSSITMVEPAVKAVTPLTGDIFTPPPLEEKESGSRVPTDNTETDSSKTITDVKNQCVKGQIRTIWVEPGSVASIPYTNEIPVSSREECSRVCYEQACNRALYTPETEICNLSFEAEEEVPCPDLTQYDRYNLEASPNSDQPALGLCITCDQGTASAIEGPSETATKDESDGSCPRGGSPLELGGQRQSCLRTSDCPAYSFCHQTDSDSSGICCVVVPIFLHKLGEKQNCSAVKENGLNACLQSYVDSQPDAQTLRISPDIISDQFNITVLTERCKNFEEYDTCTKTVLGDEYCFSFSHHLLSGLLNGVCEKDSQRVLEENQNCIQRNPFYASEFNQCTTDFTRAVKLIRDNIVQGSVSICLALDRIVDCGIPVTEKYCNQELGNVLRKIIQAVKMSNFGVVECAELQRDQQNCNEPNYITYLVEEDVANDKIPVFSDQMPAQTATECARTCYKMACVAAGFNPPTPGTNLDNTGICLLSYKDNAELATTCSSEVSRQNNYNATQPIIIHCVRCAALAIAEPPRTENKPAEVETLKSRTTTARTTVMTPPAPPPTCPNELSFVAVSLEPLTRVPTPDFTSQTDTVSVKECAQICYSTEDCVAAGFSPPAPGSDRPDRALCLLSFTESELTRAPCLEESRKVVTDAPSDKLTLIYCLQCASSVIETAPEVLDRVESIDANKPSTTSPTSKLTTTEPPTTTEIITTPTTAKSTATTGTTTTLRSTTLTTEATTPSSTTKAPTTTQVTTTLPSTTVVSSTIPAVTDEPATIPSISTTPTTTEVTTSKDPPTTEAPTEKTSLATTETTSKDSLSTTSASSPTTQKVLTTTKEVVETAELEEDLNTEAPIDEEVETIVTEIPVTTSTLIDAPKTKQDSQTTSAGNLSGGEVVTELPATEEIEDVTIPKVESTTELPSTTIEDDVSTLAVEVREATTQKTVEETEQTEEPSPIPSTTTVGSTTTAESEEASSQTTFTIDEANVLTEPGSVPGGKGFEVVEIGSAVLSVSRSQACASPNQLSFTPVPISASSVLYQISFGGKTEIDRGNLDFAPNFQDKTLRAGSARSCAQICDFRNCTVAGFNPKGSGGDCHLSFDPVPSAAKATCSGTKGVATYDARSPTLILCLQCGPAPSPVDTTEAPKTTTPVPTTVAAQQTKQPLIQCGAGSILNFHALRMTPNMEVEPPQFARKVKASSATECATTCFERICTAAGFTPPRNEETEGICFLAFEKSHPAERLCDESNRVTEYNADHPTLILCMSCETQVSIENSVRSPVIEEKREEENSGSVTNVNTDPKAVAVANIPVIRPCWQSSSVRFGVIPISPSTDTGNPNYKFQVSAKTVAECALYCYERGCTLAGYNPASPWSVDPRSGTCLMAFEGVPEKMRSCDGQKLYSQYDTSAPLLVMCMTCPGSDETIETVTAVGLPAEAPIASTPDSSKSTSAPSIETQSGSETSTQRAKVASNITEAPDVNCYNCIAYNGIPCNTGTCSGKFCIIQALESPQSGITIAQSCAREGDEHRPNGCTTQKTGVITVTICICNQDQCNHGALLSPHVKFGPRATPRPTRSPTTTTVPVTTPAPTPERVQPKTIDVENLADSNVEECQKEIVFQMFRNQGLGSSFVVARRLVRNTAAACARSCYDFGCTEAHFIPRTRTCLLAKSDDQPLANSGCTGITTGFVSEYTERDPVHMVCVVCGSPTPLQPEIPTSTQFPEVGNNSPVEKQGIISTWSSELSPNITVDRSSGIPSSTDQSDPNVRDLELERNTSSTGPNLSVWTNAPSVGSTPEVDINPPTTDLVSTERADAVYDKVNDFKSWQISKARAKPGNIEELIRLQANLKTILEYIDVPSNLIQTTSGNIIGQAMYNTRKQQVTTTPAPITTLNSNSLVSKPWLIRRSSLKQPSTLKPIVLPSDVPIPPSLPPVQMPSSNTILPMRPTTREQQTLPTTTRGPIILPQTEPPTTAAQPAQRGPIRPSTWGNNLGIATRIVTTPPPEQFEVTDESRNCVVTFEASTNMNTIALRFQNSTTVESVTECAQHCYRSGCSLAEFIPPAPFASASFKQLAACYLHFSPEPLACDRAQERHYVFPGTQVVDMTCVRCVTVGLSSPAPSVSKATSPTVPEDSNQAIIDNELKKLAVISEPGEERQGSQTVVLPDENEKGQPGRTCKVSFEVSDADRAIADRVIVFFDRRGVGNALECAELCYNSNCTAAGFDALTRLCILGNSQKAECMDSDQRVTNFLGSKQVVFHCIRCDIPLVVGENIDEPSRTVVKTNEDGKTVGSTTKRGRNLEEAFRTQTGIESTTDIPTPPHPPMPPTKSTCSGRITFEPVTQHPDWKMRVEHVETGVKTAADCARLCYQTGCSVGEFNPVTHQCAFYFGSKTNVPCDSSQRYDRYRTEILTYLKCIQCEQLQTGNEFVSDVIEDTASQAGVVAYSAVKNCSGSLSFEVALPAVFNAEEYERSLRAANTVECAKACYELGCSAAAFSASKFICYLAFDFEICSADASRQTEFETPATIALRCIKCSDASSLAIESESPPETRTEIAQIVGIDKTTTPGGACDGRLLFQAHPVEALPKLNITNDIFAESPSDCAQKCWDKGCSTAGYIPNPNMKGGVCLLSEDSSVCAPTYPFIPQFGDSRPFVISCLQCSVCNYSISQGIPDKSLPQFDIQEDASSVTECAVKCHNIGCSAAAYSDKSVRGNCLLAMKGEKRCDREEDQLAISTESKLPLTLDCVQCNLDDRRR